MMPLKNPCKWEESYVATVERGEPCCETREKVGAGTVVTTRILKCTVVTHSWGNPAVTTGRRNFCGYWGEVGIVEADEGN